jgi:hypothetical protein
VDSLDIHGVDISHPRLVELTHLADQAKPFYDWVAGKFQHTLQTRDTFAEILLTASKPQLHEAITACYQIAENAEAPLLFDGVGRSYPHARACFYFFSWIIRDAPKQRLEPLIQRIVRVTGQQRREVEIEVLSLLIFRYRTDVQTFSWDAVREIIIDRLEGSRRALRGHEKEVIARTALLTAIQAYFATHQSYGVYAKVEIADAQITIENETFDVSANLLDESGTIVRRILMPIKTRETEGGGHAHLFTRDILSAIHSVKSRDTVDFLIVVIVARNWSRREAQGISEKVDHLVLFDMNPREFGLFGQQQQDDLNAFIEGVLDGRITPKHDE